MSKQTIVIGVAIAVGFFALFLLLQSFGIFSKAPFINGVVPKSSPPGSVLTGLGIAKQTALFLDKSLQEDGSINEEYLCVDNTCRHNPQETGSSIGYVAQAYYALFQKTGEEAYKEKALRIARLILQNCTQLERVCHQNIAGLYYLYKQTGENEYKEAILSIKERIYQYSFHTEAIIGWETLGDELAILYELTEDPKYKNRLERIAQDFLANKYDLDTDENPVFYQEGDLVIRTYSIQIAWDKYLQAFRVSKNPAYLQAAKGFFRKANIEGHFEDFKRNTNAQDMNFISGLLDLKDALDDPKEKAKFGDLVHKLAQLAYSNLSDNPQNQKFNGDYGFLFNTRKEGTRKLTIHSGWRISQYLRMADETFTIH